MEAVLENAHVILNYEEESALVHDVYKVDIDFETIQASLNKGVEQLKKHSINKWLTDTRAIGGFSEDGAQWVLNEWAPGAIEAGWKYWALIVPEAMKGRVAMVQFMDIFATMGITIRVFTGEAPAREWLATV